MRYHPVLLLPILILGLGSCSPSKKLNAPQKPGVPPAMTPSTGPAPLLPETLPPLPVSEIDLPLKIAGKPLLTAIDSLVPKEFLSAGWPAYLQPACNFRYKYRFVRSALTLRCTNNRISVALRGNYQVAGGRCLCAAGKPVSPWISGFCGFAPEPMRRVDLSLATQFSFLPDYRIRTTSGTEQLTAVDKCSMSMFSMDMTREILDSIRSSVNSFCTTLDAGVARMNVTGYLHNTAARALQKTGIGPYGYLAVNPLAMRIGTLDYDRDTFRISVGISCRPELGSDSSSPAGIRSLPPLRSGDNRSGVTLYLPATYEYSFLTRLLNDALRNKSFLFKGSTVIIREVALKGIGHHQAEIRIDFAGNRNGRIYLRGTPVLDTARQTLSVPDLSYSLESKDLALKMAKTLLRGKIRRSLRGDSYLDLAALLKANLPALNTVMNRPLGSGLSLSGQIRELKLIGLLAGEHAILAQLLVRADLSVTSVGIPK